jgi:hypothetical protein
MGSASVSGGAPNLTGGANVTSGSAVAGGANLGAAGATQTPNLPGAGARADVSGGELSTNVDASGGGFEGAPGDAQRQVRDAEHQASGTSVEAGVVREAGYEGKSIGKGGGMGVSERYVPGESQVGSAERKLEVAQRTQGLEARDMREGALDDAYGGAGYDDPEAQLGRAEQLELHQRDGLAASTDVSGDVSQAQRTVANPTGTASARAEATAGREIRERAPVDPNVVSSTAHDPEGAARKRAEAEVAAKKRDATADVEVSASVSTDKPPPKK